MHRTPATLAPVGSTGEYAGAGDGRLRVCRHFAWFEVGSVKVALPHPTHHRVTQAVGRSL
jgi:hypothetical protein